MIPPAWGKQAFPQVAGVPHRPILGKRRPPNLRTKPHGGWSRAPHRLWGHPWNGDSLRSVGAILPIQRLYLKRYGNVLKNIGSRLRTPGHPLGTCAGSLRPVGTIQSIERLYQWQLWECHEKTGYRLHLHFLGSTTSITRGHQWVAEMCICVDFCILWTDVLQKVNHTGKETYWSRHTIFFLSFQ